ncbi:MAG: YqgE/AlgH family protein [Candidatus Binatia bacterium]
MNGVVISNWRSVTVGPWPLRGLVCRIVALLVVCVMGIGLQRPAAAEEKQFLTGQLLVAAPEMKDSHFGETVIYMVRHNEEGAMGVVINRPLAKGPISDLLKGLGVKSEGASGEITLHYGGPVEPKQGLVLHSSDYIRNGTIVVQDGFALTGDTEILRAISRGTGPRRSILVLGYAGWAPGQLEAEMERKDWFVIPAEEALIFDEDAETKWERAKDRRRIKI